MSAPRDNTTKRRAPGYAADSFAHDAARVAVEKAAMTLPHNHPARRMLIALTACLDGMYEVERDAYDMRPFDEPYTFGMCDAVAQISAYMCISLQSSGENSADVCKAIFHKGPPLIEQPPRG